MTGEIHALPLIRTKLERPRLPRDLIERPHLLERLKRARNRKLTLISAAAGYGKTTLAAAWLQDSPRPVAWLTLEEGDDDWIVFLNYFVAAIRTVFPDACPQTGNLRQVPQVPPVSYIAATLINEIAALSDQFILVLDDFHTIRDERIRQLVIRVIEHLTAQMHLVICCRVDPELPLARLRVRREIIEIRTTELSLSQDEVNSYLAQALGTKLPSEATVLLGEKTEGWIAGLRLVVLSMRYVDDPVRFAKSFAGSDRNIREFLVDEVLAQQPLAAQAFWLELSLLNRFCAPLCQAVTGRSLDESQDLLNESEQHNAFLIPLDYQQQWYRYHHLFQELLQSILHARVPEKEIALLHRKAGTWLAANGFVGEALSHALAAGDAELAAQWVQDCRHDLLNREDWTTLERYLNRLPHDVVQRRSALLLARGWVSDLRSQHEGFPSLLQQAEALLSTDGAAGGESEVRSLHGEIDALWSILLCWSDEGQRALAHALRAVERIPVEHAFARSLAMLFLALAYQISGQARTALHTLSKFITEASNLPDAIIARLLIGQAFVHMLEGNCHQAAHTLDQLQQISDRSRLTVSLLSAHWLLGRISYEWNDLEAARKHLIAVFERRYEGHHIMVHDSMLNLALIYQLQEKPANTKETLAALRRLKLESKIMGRVQDIDSFEARLAALQGDWQQAIRWAETPPPDMPTATLVYLELPVVTKARALIAQGTNASLQEAARLLQALLARAESTHNTYRQIATLVQLALAYQAQGQTHDALETLERALRLAEPGGFIRTFVDAGSEMVPLLHQLAERGVASDYVGQILAAFEIPPARHLPAPSQPPSQPLVEPLTDRELEVLQLLAQRLTDREIAQLLVIAQQTVRRHNSNIYQKLGVKNRREAVAKAQVLGILNSD
jgi:LuxR family maltose regulon positive regulatory protein